MRRALVRNHGREAGVLQEEDTGYVFCYCEQYEGEPVSLTMPVRQEPYRFQGFPPFFEGILPEGFQLESLLSLQKIDADDYFGQLLVIGRDTVGSVTVESL